MKELKNIVIVCDYAFFEGGAANVALQSVIAFANSTNLNVFCFAGNGEPCEELKSCGAKIVALNLPDLLGNKNKIDAFLNGIYNKKVYNSMQMLLSKLDRNETVVHIHTWTKVLTSAVFKACEQLSFPVFLTIHEYFLACPNGACYNFVDKKICNVKPMSLKCLKCNCDSRNYLHKIWRFIRQSKQNLVIRHNSDIHYIFISNFQMKQLLNRMPEVKYKHMVKNPIYVDEREKIDVQNNREYLYIGRISGEKGIELFCEAISKSKVKGVVIGAGPLLDELKEKYPNIEFLGWLNKTEIRNRLKRTRALIFPSLWFEGSPLTVPEVQAFGIPCIVTNCSSATDDIIDGENGLIISPEVDEIYNSIIRLEDNNYLKTLSYNTFAKFDMQRTSNDFYVSQLLKIYESRN